MNTLPACPKCQSPYVYEDGELLICPECSYEFSNNANEDNIEHKKYVMLTVSNSKMEIQFQLLKT